MDKPPSKSLITTRHPKYLWVYSAANPWTLAWHERIKKRRLAKGIDIKYYLNSPAELNYRWFPFPELDRMWRSRNKALLNMYEGLLKSLEGRNILILYNGANLHPEFVDTIKGVLKVYTCGDPESASVLSQPLSPGFDIHLVNHYSDVARFRKWGHKHVYFWPFGSLTLPEEIPDINPNSILDIRNRPHPAAIFCEYSVYRRKRLDQLVKAFPEAYYAGKGWPRGRVDWNVMWDTYKHTQIGWNMHNSTGFNFRTYDLLAYGTLQICDNKHDLHQILKPGIEVVGYDTTKECIDLTRYYLDHPDEQRRIALAGWRRWKKDYTPDAVWDRLEKIVLSHLPQSALRPYSGPLSIDLSRIPFRPVNPLKKFLRKLWPQR